MKNVFMTLVVLKILCFIPSKIYTQNISYHNLTIDVVDIINNSTYPSRISFEAVAKTNVLVDNTLMSALSNPTLLLNEGYMDIIPKKQYLKNRTVSVSESPSPAQYFGLIGAVFLHPLTHALFAFEKNEKLNKSINTYSKTFLGKLNKKYPAVICTPPDCVPQWDGNN